MSWSVPSAASMERIGRPLSEAQVAAARSAEDFASRKDCVSLSAMASMRRSYSGARSASRVPLSKQFTREEERKNAPSSSRKIRPPAEEKTLKLVRKTSEWSSVVKMYATTRLPWLLK